MRSVGLQTQNNRQNTLMNRPKRDLHDIKRASNGKWNAIFSSLAPTLLEAFNSPDEGFSCPVCGGDDRFSFTRKGLDDAVSLCRGCAESGKQAKPRDGIQLLMDINNDSLPWVLKLIDDCLNGSSASPVYQGKLSKGDTKKRTGSMQKYCDAILNRSDHAPIDEAIKYLHSRNLAGAENLGCWGLRYNKGVSVKAQGKFLTRDNGKWMTYPAIVGLLTNGQKQKTGVTVIRLTEQGFKAAWSIERELKKQHGINYRMPDKPIYKRTDSTVGSAIRFGGAESTYHVGEGIETMLAVALELNTMSVAACCTAPLLASVDIPPNVETLVIWADKDRNNRGIGAAWKLRDKYKHQCNIKIMLPDSPIPSDKKSIDWLDCKSEIASKFPKEEV